MRALLKQKADDSSPAFLCGWMDPHHRPVDYHQPLCVTELHPRISSGGQDSNLRPQGYEPCELPLLYPALFVCLGGLEPPPIRYYGNATFYAHLACVLRQPDHSATELQTYRLWNTAQRYTFQPEVRHYIVIFYCKSINITKSTHWILYFM